MHKYGPKVNLELYEKDIASKSVPKNVFLALTAVLVFNVVEILDEEEFGENVEYEDEDAINPAAELGLLVST